MAIGGRFSPDFGASWHAPFILHKFPNDATDCGYPSTVVLEDEHLLTDITPMPQRVILDISSGC